MTSFSYDAFASHATDPDGALVRAVEARVETFHTRYGVAARYKRELELCVDGRDFVFNRRDRHSENGGDIIEPVVRSYQRQSRALLVFSGPSSRNHPWVGREVEWWTEDRSDGPVYFAMTHGAEPSDNVANMPKALLDRGGGDTAVFFDLRGYYRRRRTLWQRLTEVEPERTRALRAEARGWRSVREFEEEVGKIAARLTCDAIGEDASLDAIESSYVAAVRNERRWRRGLTALATVCLIAASSLATYWGHSALEEARRARVSSWIQQAEALSESASPDLIQALAYAASAVDDGSDPRAARVLHKIMRRLAPIERTLAARSTARQSEQTQTAALTTDGRYLLTGGRDSILHMLELATGQQAAALLLEAGRIRTIAPLKTEESLIVGTDRGVRFVRVDRDTSGRPTLRSVAQALTGERIGALDLDHARGQVVVGTFSGKVLTLPLVASKTGWPATPLTTILDPRYAAKGETDIVSGIFGIKARGDRLVIAGIDGVLTVMDRRGETPSQQWQTVHPHAIFALDVSQDGAQIAVADDDGRLSIYDAATGARREAQLRAINPASLAPSWRGNWVASRADELASVGVSFDMSGALLAVTSHDRTVKFLLARELVPLSIAVHAAPTRGAVFDPTNTAYTFGDDGVISAVRPQDSPLDLELAEVDNFVLDASRRSLVVWPKSDKGSTRLITAELDRRASLGAASEVKADIWNGIAADNGRVFLRAAASTIVHVYNSAGSAGCGRATLDHANETGHVEIVRAITTGTAPGEIVTVAERQGETGRSVVRGWDTSTCQDAWQHHVATPAEQISVSHGAIAARLATRRVTVFDPRKEESPAFVDFTDDVVAVAALAAPSGLIVQTKSALCVCARRGRETRVAEGACAARSQTYACAPVDGSHSGPPMPVRRLFAAPSGLRAIATSDFAAMWLIDFARGRIQNVSPRQLRPVEPPFAFNATESLLAVPAGDTGIRIIDIDSLKTVVELPTPSRVMRLAFAPGTPERLISVDANILRVWDWSRETLLREACRRWPTHVPVSQAIPRNQICRSHMSKAL